jgi:hypothetical protein
MSDEFLLGWSVFDEPAIRFSGEAELDWVAQDDFARLEPDLIFIEGGLFTGIPDRPWKMPPDSLEYAGRMPVVVVEADRNRLYQHRPRYDEAAAFLGASFAKVSWSEDLIKGVQARGDDYDSFVLCRPDEMPEVDKPFRTAYEGVAKVGVEAPTVLGPVSSVVAQADEKTCGTLADDIWVDKSRGFVWGSALVQPQRTVCLLAGSVVSDWILETAPDNTRWLTQLVAALLHEQRAEYERASSRLRSPHKLFLSHRSIDKPVVRAVGSALHRRGIDTWLDENEINVGDSITTMVGAGLGTATHVVVFWSHACVDAPWVARELSVAVHGLIEREIPMFVVRLDDAPVPPVVGDLLRIDARQLSPDEVADKLSRAVWARPRAGHQDS